VHIITYTCENCGADQTRPAGAGTDGMCQSCGYPMRIDDMFSDRRRLSVPVLFERRELARPEAA